MSLSKEVLEGVYRPEYIPEDGDVIEFVLDERQTQAESLQGLVRKAVKTRANPIDSTIPLTLEEAEEADKIIQKTLGRITETRMRISKLRKFIDNVASPKDGKELSFKLNISKRPTLRRAVRRVFGFDTDTITYSMYKEALERKQALEKQEADNYLRNS